MTPKKFIVRRSPVNPQFAARRLSDDVEEDANHGCLCFALGVLFGPLGLLLAAIVGKAKGLVSALWGFLVFWLVSGLIILCLRFALH